MAILDLSVVVTLIVIPFDITFDEIDIFFLSFEIDTFDVILLHLEFEYFSTLTDLIPPLSIAFSITLLEFDNSSEILGPLSVEMLYAVVFVAPYVIIGLKQKAHKIKIIIKLINLFFPIKTIPFL